MLPAPWLKESALKNPSIAKKNTKAACALAVENDISLTNGSTSSIEYKLKGRG
jgi:hypothetical protein